VRLRVHQLHHQRVGALSHPSDPLRTCPDASSFA
jgi:hypothetical protein